MEPDPRLLYLKEETPAMKNLTERTDYGHGEREEGEEGCMERVM